MVFQYIIIGIVIVACLVYATIIIWKNGKSQLKCDDYKCAGCPFFEKCEKKQEKTRKYAYFLKKVAEKFGGTKKM